MIYSKDGYLVADAGRIHCRTDSEMDANAQLIAAAPELLEALKAALPILDDTLIEIRAKAENDARFEAVARTFQQQCADARAAIEKATGEKFGGDVP